MTGLLLVDKPAGVTSHDVVDHIRAATGMRRIGHTGTLDPNATGLLVLCLGSATRLSEHLTGLDKVYVGIMRLGITTTSYDIDGEPVDEAPIPALTIPEIQAVCDRFTGEVEQVPPMVSAVKVGGERLYKKARKGETVERKPRRVQVHEFTVLTYSKPDIEVRVACSSGTYVRALCHEVGQVLGCGGALASLRRTRVGPHDVEEALPMEQFQEPADVEAQLLPMDEALDLPIAVVLNRSRSVLTTGGTLSGHDLRAPCPVSEGWVQLKSSSGQLLGIATVEENASGVRIFPKRVFAR